MKSHVFRVAELKFSGCQYTISKANSKKAKKNKHSTIKSCICIVVVMRTNENCIINYHHHQRCHFSPSCHPNQMHQAPQVSDLPDLLGYPKLNRTLSK